MTAAPLVRVDRPGDRVAVLLLDRAERLNALSSAAAADLAAAVADVESDPEVGAIVVAGAGRCFSAGADIAELEGLDGPPAFAAFVTRLEGALSALARSPLPSVAAVHGVALGGGLELALACDLRIAESTARLGMPEIKLGLLPAAAGTARLTRMLPPAIAKQMLLTGEPLAAGEAHRLGLVNEVVDDGAAREGAVRLAALLAGRPPRALAAGKRVVDEGGEMPLDAAIAFERETVAALFGSEDRAEGIRAFLEKRPPTFTGR
jgi:enoyl-CoA hydratase